MPIKLHTDLTQGSDEWLAARCGLLTASEMHLILTPTLKIAANDKQRTHLYELLAQRITKHVEPFYVSDDMLRGHVDEAEAIALYEQHYAPVDTVGFITNDEWGFTLGYSPDGLVGDDGLIEVKSRRQKYQVETFVVHVADQTIPADYMLQIQTGLLVTGRKWCDLISYSAGLPMARIRAYPYMQIHGAILSAASAFEANIRVARDKYDTAIVGCPTTERRAPEQEMMV